LVAGFSKKGDLCLLHSTGRRRRRRRSRRRTTIESIHSHKDPLMRESPLPFCDLPVCLAVAKASLTYGECFSASCHSVNHVTPYIPFVVND